VKASDSTHSGPIAGTNKWIAFLVYPALGLVCLVTVLPFFYMVTRSFRSSSSDGLFLPKGDGLLGVNWDQFTLEKYITLFTELAFHRHIINSFFFASMVSVLGVLFCAMGGYALAKFEFKGKKTMMLIVLGMLVAPYALLLAPLYELLFKIGVLDTFGGLILPLCCPAFGVFLFRQSMLNAVPNEIMESARMDGCGEIRLFFTMVIPLVRPMMGALMLFFFLGAWNNFLWPQIVLQSPERMPLSVAIVQLRSVYGQDTGRIMAGTIVSIAPVMVLFLLLQREFVAGLTSGAVKG